MSTRLAALVLAAGDGTRMRSELPKVLHPLCGRPMIDHVVGALHGLPLRGVVVVVGAHAEMVTKALEGSVDALGPVEFVEQRVRRGTGDAVSVGLTAALFDGMADGEDDLLVLAADAPLLRSETLAHLVAAHRETGVAATVLTATVADPAGLGRVVRDSDGGVDRIVEDADADDAERAIDEVNTSIYCFQRHLLAPALRRLSSANAQGEYYLTDVLAVLRETGHHIAAVHCADSEEASFVNDRAELAAAERTLRSRINDEWLRSGVTMVDPGSTYIDAQVQLAADVRLLPGTMLEGATSVASGCVIGPDCRLVDVTVGPDCEITYSVIRESAVGVGCVVGPFAHIRPGVRLGDGVKVGDFVELKNAAVAAGAKVPHLAYLGDAEIGPGTNIGAGTITANYDGTDKHRTILGADVRTGSNSVLVAPVTVGDGAVLGAGAVVTRDVPPGAVAKGVPATWDEPDPKP